MWGAVLTLYFHRARQAEGGDTVPAALPLIMIELSDRLAFATSTRPSTVNRDDLLQVLEQAGLGKSHAHEMIAAHPPGMMTVDREGLRHAMQLARAKSRRL